MDHDDGQREKEGWDGIRWCRLCPSSRRRIRKGSLDWGIFKAEVVRYHDVS